MWIAVETKERQWRERMVHKKGELMRSEPVEDREESFHESH